MTATTITVFSVTWHNSIPLVMKTQEVDTPMWSIGATVGQLTSWRSLPVICQISERGARIFHVGGEEMVFDLDNDVLRELLHPMFPVLNAYRKTLFTTPRITWHVHLLVILSLQVRIQRRHAQAFVYGRRKHHIVCLYRIHV